MLTQSVGTTLADIDNFTTVKAGRHRKTLTWPVDIVEVLGLTVSSLFLSASAAGSYSVTDV